MRPKTAPILNNYLTQTMENNAHSGVRLVQAEMSFIFIFPSFVRIEKAYIVFEVLDQRADYVNRWSKRLHLMNYFDRPIAADSLSRPGRNPKA